MTKYVIVGKREEGGDLAVYDRRETRPDKEEAERICQSFNYSQLVVVEFKTGGYAQRYAYDREPRIREVPLNS